MEQAIKVELERLERLLMDPTVRRDRERIEALLTADFVEFGTSGRVWTREATLEALASETYSIPQAEDFAFRFLTTKVVLVTYRALRKAATDEQTVALRSSIWTQESGRWQICFHQGTRAEAISYIS